MLVRYIAIAITALALTACESPQDRATKSGFRTPSASGEISDIPSGSGRRSGNGSANVGGFAFAVGSLGNGDGFAGYAGLLPGTTVTSPPTTGRVFYDAEFRLGEISNIDLNGSLLTGDTRTRAGNITLMADFDDNRVTGAGDGLRVDGTIRGDGFRGDADWRGVDGSIRGLVGSDQVIGAFHGNDEDVIFAGGLVGDAR